MQSLLRNSLEQKGVPVIMKSLSLCIRLKQSKYHLICHSNNIMLLHIPILIWISISIMVDNIPQIWLIMVIIINTIILTMWIQGITTIIWETLQVCNIIRALLKHQVHSHIFLSHTI